MITQHTTHMCKSSETRVTIYIIFFFKDHKFVIFQLPAFHAVHNYVSLDESEVQPHPSPLNIISTSIMTTTIMHPTYNTIPLSYSSSIVNGNNIRRKH